MAEFNIENLKKIGFSEFFIDKFQKTKENQKIARIIWQHAGFYEAITEDLKNVRAFLSGKLKHKLKDNLLTPVAGDWVILEDKQKTLFPVVEVLPRFSTLIRKFEEKTQILAANIDIVFIVMSVDKSFQLTKLEKFVDIAILSNIKFEIILNKIDLSNNLKNIIDEIQLRYPQAKIFPINSLNLTGYQELSKTLEPFKTSVLIGPSGVGKSTIINNLYGKNIMKTSSPNPKTMSGRHTTTTRKLIILPNNHLIIDTPGIRTISIENIFSERFKIINEIALNCKFSDCKHYTEPGCAVKEAVKNNLIPEKLYNEYLKLITSQD